MSKIKILPEQLIDKIAAGEIIERPASIVKELIENSIDAGADKIIIDVIDGGKKSIVAADNGEGMDEDDLKLSIQRFTTSKIRSEDDLFKIKTYGFRGEAFPSIASVSQMKIVTKNKESESGYYLLADAGDVVDFGHIQREKGTTVEVKNIFYSLPARLKFLKSGSTEYQHIFDIVSKISLSNLDKSFTLIKDSKTETVLEKNETLVERVEKIWNTNIKSSLIPLVSSSAALAVSGFIINPHSEIKGRKGIVLFVNNRVVYDRIVTHAVREAFKKAAGKDEAPSAVIFLTVPFDAVDVNVHPAKNEVRFVKSFGIHQLIYDIVENTLRKTLNFSERLAFNEFNVLTEDNSKIKKYASSTEVVPNILSEAVLPYSKKGYFESLIYIGSYFDEFLILSAEDGLILIDQHAAFERIAYENLKKRYLSETKVRKNLLLFPKIISTDEKEGFLLIENLPKLDNYGFEMEQAGNNEFVIKTVPEGVKEDYEKLLWGVLHELSQYGSSQKSFELNEKIFMTIACHSVVRGKKKLSYLEINDLLSKLDKIDFSMSCPHGRPVYVKLDRNFTEKLFKRR